MIEFVDCRTCKTDCVRADGNYGYRFCDKYTHPPITNADRIRSMSDEELEEGIRKLSLGYEPWCDNHCKMNGDDDCNRCLRSWLQQPAENTKEMPDESIHSR